MLEPTELQPPFNEIHTEDLTHWEGEDSYAAWLKLVDRIGHFTERPGLAEYVRVMGEGGSAKALREWGNEFGADPLAAEAWTRVGVLEGESSSQRIKREQREARARDERRQACATHCPARAHRSERTRGSLGTLIVMAIVVAVGVASYGGYRTFEAGQRRAAANAVFAQAHSPEELRVFLVSYGDLPLAARARAQLSTLDDASWNAADEARTRRAYEAYLAAFPLNASPPPAYGEEARRLLTRARLIQNAQQLLLSLGYFHETADGRMTRATTTAVSAFQTAAARANPQITVTGAIDEDGLLIEDLTLAAAERARPVATVAELAADHPPPSHGQTSNQGASTPPQPSQNYLATLVAQSRAPLSRSGLPSVCRPDWRGMGSSRRRSRGRERSPR